MFNYGEIKNIMVRIRNIEDKSLSNSLRYFELSKKIHEQGDMIDSINLKLQQEIDDNTTRSKDNESSKYFKIERKFLDESCFHEIIKKETKHTTNICVYDHESDSLKIYDHTIENVREKYLMIKINDVVVYKKGNE